MSVFQESKKIKELNERIVQLEKKLKATEKDKKNLYRIIGFIIVIILILVFMFFAQAKQEAIPQVVVDPIVELRNKIIFCESSWNENAVGALGEKGLAQFFPETFDWLSELSGLNGDINNPQDQIELLDWSLRNGRGYLWVCYDKVLNK
jgi:hypothetical protein